MFRRLNRFAGVLLGSVDGLAETAWPPRVLTRFLHQIIYGRRGHGVQIEQAVDEGDVIETLTTAGRR